MIVITVNGERCDVEPQTTVAALVASLGSRDHGRGVAVALDGEVIPRPAWGETIVGDGGRVEIVVAVQGG